MMHHMKLLEGPYRDIANGSKTIEIRLFDEKRRKVKVGDRIELSKLPDLVEKIQVNVLYLERYASKEELVDSIPLEKFGSRYSSKEELLAGDRIYSEERVKEYGFLVIGIERVCGE